MRIVDRMKESFEHREVEDALNRGSPETVITSLAERRIARRAKVEASAALRLKRAKEKA